MFIPSAPEAWTSKSFRLSDIPRIALAKYRIPIVVRLGLPNDHSASLLHCESIQSEFDGASVTRYRYFARKGLERLISKAELTQGEKQK
jgi:hypothetical protein